VWIWNVRLAYWITEAADTSSEYVILIIFHCSDGCRNAPHCYIIGTLPVLLKYMINAVDFYMSDSIAQIILDDSCRLGCGCVWFGGQFPTFLIIVVSIFRVKPSFVLFNRQYEGITYLRNVGNCWPNNTALPTRSIATLTALVLYSLVLWQSCISFKGFCYSGQL
jgi:hypothetical protein